MEAVVVERELAVAPLDVGAGALKEVGCLFHRHRKPCTLGFGLLLVPTLPALSQGRAHCLDRPALGRVSRLARRSFQVGSAHPFLHRGLDLLWEDLEQFAAPPLHPLQRPHHRFNVFFCLYQCTFTALAELEVRDLASDRGDGLAQAPAHGVGGLPLTGTSVAPRNSDKGDAM